MFGSTIDVSEFSDHLAFGVDPPQERLAVLPTQGAKIMHNTFIPEERMRSREPAIGVYDARLRPTHHLASVVNTPWNTVATAQGAKIGDAVVRVRFLELCLRLLRC